MQMNQPSLKLDETQGSAWQELIVRKGMKISEESSNGKHANADHISERLFRVQDGAQWVQILESRRVGAKEVFLTAFTYQSGCNAQIANRVFDVLRKAV